MTRQLKCPTEPAAPAAAIPLLSRGLLLSTIQTLTDSPSEVFSSPQHTHPLTHIVYTCTRDPCVLWYKKVLALGYLLSICFRSLRNRSLCTFACMQSTHAHTLAHTYTHTHTHALAVSPPHIRTPSHEPMPAKYLAFKGGDFRDEEMGEGAIGDEKNRTRGGVDSKLVPSCRHVQR